MKKTLKILLIILIFILLIAGGYVAYVLLTYSRIPDNRELIPSGDASFSNIEPHKSYTIVTQNAGFGAYTADFTFFMDGGSQSRAASKESVINCINAAGDEALGFSPDFVLFQEIDTDSTRSYHVNQHELLNSKFDGYTNVFAQNYHSAYLMYPFTKPHGKSNSGIVTYSKAKITSSVRRSFEISTGFSKLLDLDRCYSVSRIPVSNGKELVLYNVHMSAYGGNNSIRTSQMTMLFNDMINEYNNGNYVICGGDFNHDFTGNSVQLFNNVEECDYGWSQPFPSELLPEGLSRCINYSSDKLVATTRNCNIPYGEDSFVAIIDGYIVSDNVKVTYVENIDTGYVYSDHNPVVMKFELEE